MAQRFNPRLPGGRRPNAKCLQTVYAYVSIHAFRGEGDLLYVVDRITNDCVSIHAFRGEGDPPHQRRCTHLHRFNPRLPGGRRRNSCDNFIQDFPFQSTPSGGKATRPVVQIVTHIVVSIHAFRGEGDAAQTRKPPHVHRFNPRLPGGRRHSSAAAAYGSLSFNPRLPGGRRPGNAILRSLASRFQSTPSGGKATSAPP